MYVMIYSHSVQYLWLCHIVWISYHNVSQMNIVHFENISPHTLIVHEIKCIQVTNIANPRFSKHVSTLKNEQLHVVTHGKEYKK